MAQVSDGIKKVLEATEAILPDIAAAAKDGDMNRRVRDDIIEKLKETGALGLSKPERFGGLGANAREMLEVSTLVGRADGGAAWVVMLTNVRLARRPYRPRGAERYLGRRQLQPGAHRRADAHLDRRKG